MKHLLKLETTNYRHKGACNRGKSSNKKRDNTGSQSRMSKRETASQLSLINYQFEITGFLMRNSLPFKLAPNLNRLIKQIVSIHSLTDLKNSSITREKASEIAGDIIGPTIKNKLLADLKKSLYSISIDEAIIQKTEYLAINARYLENDESIQTVTKLIALVDLGKSCTGETLYNAIANLLFTGDGSEERKQNLIGISCDGASKMISTGDKSVTSRLKKEIPHLIGIHDICHALNLVLDRCLDSFPVDYRKIIETISKTFSHSSQRNDILRECILEVKKTEAEIEILAVKQYVLTR